MADIIGSQGQVISEFQVRGAGSGGAPIYVAVAGTDVAVTASSAASPIGISLPAVGGATNYLAGFQVGGTGATAPSGVQVTITGLLGGTAYWYLAIPAGTANSVQLDIEFPRPWPATGPNVAIGLSVQTFGVGNLLQSLTAHGFYR
jgi:hypothetical protein